MSMTNAVETVLPLSIYTVLKGEHTEVSLLMSALKAAPQGARNTIFDKLRQELLSHAKAEEATVYRRLRSKLDESDLVDESEHDHEEIEQLLITLDSSDEASTEWLEHFEQLKATVELHVEKEEEHTFDLMKSLFTEEESEEMAMAFHDKKEEILTKGEEQDKGDEA